ncbi:hypothetical protein CCICO_10460 [Corynebacterium ciconiae DSM 44920]|nr:hypothetical protein CCICO_10460 [Corynebacterium ciconiae DSM 44920]
MILYWPVSIAGAIGAVQIAGTRPDAFDAADRKDKWTWFGMVLGSALATFIGFPILSWVGIVVIGVYWWDVRPQIKSILNGEYY